MTLSVEKITILILILFSLVALFIVNPYLRIIFGSLSDYFFEQRFKREFKKFTKKRK